MARRLPTELLNRLTRRDLRLYGSWDKPDFRIKPNWNDPITRALTTATLFENRINLADPGDNLVNSGVVLTSDGGAWDTANTDYIMSSDQGGGGNHSMLMVGTVLTTPGDAWIMHAGNSSASDVSADFNVIYTSLNRWRIRQRATNSDSGGTANLPDNSDFFVIASGSLGTGSNGTARLLNKNAVQINATGLSPLSSRGSSYPTWGFSDGNGYEGDAYYGCHWTRVLDQDEEAKLWREPFHFFVPERKIFFVSSAATALEQEGFRFRNDDGSETTATWAAVQDTNISAASGTRRRLRVLLNATGDPAAGQYQLEVKKSTDSDTAYRKIQ